MRFSIVMFAVVALAGTAMAADVPSETLSQMGIQGMQTVSDAEGMAIRGKGGITDMNKLFLDRVNLAATQDTAIDLLSSPIPKWGDEVRLVNRAMFGFVQEQAPWTRPEGSAIQRNDLKSVNSRLDKIRQTNEIGAGMGVGTVAEIRQTNDASLPNNWGVKAIQRNSLDSFGTFDVNVRSSNSLLGTGLGTATSRQTNSVFIR